MTSKLKIDYSKNIPILDIWTFQVYVTLNLIGNANC